jgi:CHAT domain-containing protein/tetratricopeptide (TPR) repeat protein
VAEAEDFGALLGACFAAFFSRRTEAEFEGLRLRAAPFRTLGYDASLSTFGDVCTDLLNYQRTPDAHIGQDEVHRFLLWFSGILFDPEQQAECLHSIAIYFLANEQQPFARAAFRREWRIRRTVSGSASAQTDLYLQLAVAADEVGRDRRAGTLLKAAAICAEKNSVTEPAADLATRLLAYWLALENSGPPALWLLEKAGALATDFYQATPLQVQLGWTLAICESALRPPLAPRPKLMQIAVYALRDIRENRDPAERFVEFDGLVHALDRTQYGSLGVLSMAATLRIVEETGGEDLSREDRLILKNNYGNALLRGKWLDGARSVFEASIQATPSDWLTDPNVLYQLAHAHAGVGYSYFTEGGSADGPLARAAFESAALAFGRAADLLQASGRQQFHDSHIWSCSGSTHFYLGEIDSAHEDFARALLLGNWSSRIEVGALETLSGHDYDTPLQYAEALSTVGAGYAAALFGKLAVASVHRSSLPDESSDGRAEQFIDSRSFVHRTLIDLLYTLGRINEAEQAFDLLRLSAHEHFTRRSLPLSAVAPLLGMTSIERETLISIGLAAEGARNHAGLPLTIGMVIDGACSGAGLRLDQAGVAKLSSALAELDGTLRSQFATRATVPGEDDLARKLGAGLDSDAAVLRYVVTDARLIVSIIHGSTYRNRSVAVPRKEIGALAFALRKHCRTQLPASARGMAESQREMTKLARELYELIMRPVVDEVGQLPPVLYLELDSPLNTVPFAMLFDGERYLCELTTLLYLSRRTTTERMPSPDLQDGSLRTAVLASDMGFAGPLPGAAAEASAVQAALVGQSQFDEVTFYVGDDCTAQALLDELTREDNGRGLVHLASHATFNPTCETLSALCLSDRGVSLRELRERIEASRCPPALIVLSACGTGRADLDVEGFSVMLLRNGVGSVVSTLWESIDTSAPAFFGQMYATGFDPRSARSVASAIRSTALKMLQASADPDSSWLAHPSHWAPYVITTATFS